MFGKEIQELVKRNDWQNIRKSFLGTWKVHPESNILTLRNWLGDNIKETETDKLKITLNYLTGSGFRTRMITHPDIDQLREEVKRELRTRVTLPIPKSEKKLVKTIRKKYPQFSEKQTTLLVKLYAKAKEKTNGTKMGL